VRNVVLLLIFFVMVAVHVVPAEESAATGEAAAGSAAGTFVSKERQLKLLQLKEAELRLEDARTQYERKKADYEGMKELYERPFPIVSGALYRQYLSEFEGATSAYDTAALELERTKLGFLQDASRISIIEATQEINPEGERLLRFRLMNTSSASEAMVTDEDLKNRGQIEARLRIENILVTVLHEGIQIGKPFEIRIPFLDYGDVFKGTFILQQEKIESVDLNIEYLGKIDTRKVYLEKQSGEDIVRITSLRFAQEGNAGESVLFDLELERLAEDAATFALEVVNLPEYITYRFEEKGNQLSQVKFAERMATRALELRCYVPEELGQELLDRPIDFFVVVGPERNVRELKSLAAEIAPQPIAEEQISELQTGLEQLRLTPRGRPELQLFAANLYFEKDPGEPVDFSIVVRNTGTVTLREVRLDTEKPYDWTSVINPELIDKIEPKQELPAAIRVILPDGIGTGIYEMQVVAKCQYEGEPIESPDKNFRISIKSRVNLLGTAVIVMLLVVAMLGLAVFTIRLARR